MCYFWCDWIKLVLPTMLGWADISAEQSPPPALGHSLQP